MNQDIQSTQHTPATQDTLASTSAASTSAASRRRMLTDQQRQQLLILVGLAFLLGGWFYHRWQEQQDPDAFRAMLREEQSAVRVQVEGDVERTGIHTLPGGSLVSDALTAAQPTVPLSEVRKEWLALPVFDGMKIQLWKKSQGPVQLSINRMDGTTMGLLLIPLDINTATAEELAALPELGPKTAQAIVDFRTANGPFSSVDDLGAVRGIGEKTIEGLRFQVIASPLAPEAGKGPTAEGRLP